MKMRGEFFVNASEGNDSASWIELAVVDPCDASSWHWQLNWVEVSPLFECSAKGFETDSVRNVDIVQTKKVNYNWSNKFQNKKVQNIWKIF